MPLFNRKKKVPIQIIKTESLTKPNQSDPATPGKTTAKKNKPAKEDVQSGIQISILGKQQLAVDIPGEIKEQLSPEELQAVAQEFSRLALPDIIQKAQAARKAGKLHEAILILLQSKGKSESIFEIDEEWKLCLYDLENPAIFQRITNGQLAIILFSMAKFKLLKSVALGKLLESRLTFECENPDLRRNLEPIGALQYYCYCLSEFERALDIPTLGAVQEDFKSNHELTANNSIHFVVCKESNKETDWTISDHRISQRFTTIPLERAKMRQAIISGNAVGFLQNKVSVWMFNHHLFNTTRPVDGQQFFGRERFSNEVIDWVNQGQSFYVLGNRRMGKTSLIQHLHSLGAFRDFLYAFVDLQAFTDEENFGAAIQAIYYQWKDDLQKKNRKLAENLAAHISEALAPDKRLKRFLDTIRDARYKGVLEAKCLVIFDDMNLLFLAENKGKSLWQRGAGAFIRSLHTSQELVSFGFTVWDFETRDVIEHEFTHSSGKESVIYLGPLAEEECRIMVERIGGIINMRFERESLDEIYKESGGHPLWTRLLCDSISNTRESLYEQILVKPVMVAKAAVEFMSENKVHLQTALKALTPPERKVIEVLAQSTEVLFSNEISGKAQLPEKELQRALIHLERYGWLKSNSDGSYLLRMNLLNRYFQT